MHDIAIIGAGPAGSTLARMLSGRYKILLIDKRTLDSAVQELPFKKCCGGLLAPDAQAMLSKMGLGLPREILVGPQLFVVRTIDLKRNLERYYQRYYINIDREKFDRWLVSLVPDSVDKRFGCLFRSFEEEEDGYRVHLTVGGRMLSESVKIIVGADGAASRIRKRAAADSELPRAYMAIQQWVEVEESQPYFSVFFNPDLTDFYCWTIPKENNLIVGGAFFPRQEASRRFELLKEALARYGYRFGRSVRKEGALLLRPVSTSQLCVGKGGIALVGEAAGWISPSSGEGLSYAFHSALSLAEVFREGTENFLDRYKNNTRCLARNIFLKNLKSQFIFRPELRMLVMRSGIRSKEIS